MVVIYVQSPSEQCRWRIDYFCVSKSLEGKLHDAIIHSDVMGSDHCPVELLIDKEIF